MPKVLECVPKTDSSEQSLSNQRRANMRCRHAYACASNQVQMATAFKVCTNSAATAEFSSLIDHDYRLQGPAETN